MNILSQITSAWCVETAAPSTPGAGTGPHGQCAVTALVAQDQLGGEILRTEIPGLGSHYWNRLPGGGELDLTRAQYADGVQIPRGVAVPRSRLLEGERALAARTPQRYELLRARAMPADDPR